MFGEPECCADFVEADCDCGSPEFILLAQRHEEFDEHRLLCGDGDLFHDFLVCMTGIAVPLLRLRVGVIARVGLAVLHPKTSMVTDLLACGAELLAMVLYYFAVAADHTGRKSCRGL